MDEHQRYKEPKKLGDVIKDMYLDSDHLKDTIKSQFTEKISQNLKKYARIVDKLDVSYSDANKHILNIDRYHTQEKISLARARLSVKAGRMTQKDINERICAIQKDLDDFEIQHTNINTSLRKIATHFSSKEDTMEYNEKTNAYCSLFMEIYCDLEDICEQYSTLLSRARTK